MPFAPVTVPAGASFADMVALKGTSDIGDQINKRIVGPLAAANNLADVPDFNDANKLGSGKEMVGFRNIAVHDYQALQLPIVEAVITKHLGDFTAYSQTLLLKNAAQAQ